MGGVEQDSLAAGGQPALGFGHNGARLARGAQGLPGSARQAVERRQALSSGQLDDIRVDRVDEREQFGWLKVGGDENDVQPGRQRACAARQIGGTVRLQRTWCAGHDV